MTGPNPLTAFATQASPSVSLGGTISDTAVVVGNPLAPPANRTPGGTVSFSLYGPDDPTCAASPVFTSGGIPAKSNSHSGTFTPTLPGTYRWVASYSGDPYYAPRVGRCADSTEAVLVTVVTPTVTTQASPSVAVGGTVTDTATLTGGMAPTGTMRFRIYQPSDTTCAGPAVGGSDVTITDPASTTSAPFSPKQVGLYKWRAFYLGDPVNGVSSSACGDANESVDITPGPTTPGSGTPGPPGSTPAGPCDPVATGHAILTALAATLTGKPSGFKSACSAGLRIVLRAKEIRPGNPGYPHRDGFTTMTNILSHIAPNGPALNFALNSNGLALRAYAQSQGKSLISFLIVHVRPDKKPTSTEALEILTLG
ncbi:MAG: hypothetical protein ACR2KV_15470 [Solirubrobacteraceae bacterium]